MKLISLATLTASASNIAMFGEKIIRQTDEQVGPLGISPASDKLFAVFLKSLGYVIDTAKWLELKVTTATGERCFELLKSYGAGNQVVLDRQRGAQLAAACYQVTTALSDELDGHHAYIVGLREAKLIEDTLGGFGIEVVTLFPDTRRDISDGATCRAFELWTASVMHMMRVAEIGVKALADHLAVKAGATWGGTIANVNKALADCAHAKGDPPLRSWASETATYLNFVKEAFRNPAMHPERSFSQEEAVLVYDNCRAFMRMLTKRLAPGAGDPL